MRRRLSGGGSRKGVEMVNPMESVVNLIDIMLIFACGLIVSIVSLWNIDLKLADKLNEGGADQYEDIGRLYEDPDTGKLYIIRPAPTEPAEE